MMNLVGRINVYTCKNCSKRMITIDRDKGVTPMFKVCHWCKGDAVSAMYPDWAQELEPSFEWYKLTEEEAREHDLQWPGVYEYWKDGGLSFRPMSGMAIDDPVDLPGRPRPIVQHSGPNRHQRRAARKRMRGE